MTFGLIALAPNDWLGQWVNRQQLLSRLGRRIPIVYSTGARTVWVIGQAERPKSTMLGAIDRLNDVWVDSPPRWLIRWPKFHGLDDVAVKLYSKRLARKLANLGAVTSVAYIFHPAFLPYVKHLGASRLVYHAYDLFDHQPGWNHTLEAAEQELLRTADIVIVPSQALADELASKVNRPIHILLNAADVETFMRVANERSVEPDDLADIPHPRIGYLGSLHPQIDYSLVRRLAEYRPTYHWVFVGPLQRQKDLASNPDWKACLALPNVHMLGEKRFYEMPSYAANMDVNVLVYQVSDASWTKVAYPLKVHEYLAAGRPIISVDLPMLRHLDTVIQFASGLSAWVQSLDEALHQGGRGTSELRQSAAKDHSWDQRVDCLNRWLYELTTK